MYCNVCLLSHCTCYILFLILINLKDEITSLRESDWLNAYRHTCMYNFNLRHDTKFWYILKISVILILHFVLNIDSTSYIESKTYLSLVELIFENIWKSKRYVTVTHNIYYIKNVCYLCHAYTCNTLLCKIRLDTITFCRGFRKSET